jgi:hypothetical protein
MYENQVQNKPTAAYWLSMIGGILGLLGGLGLIALGAVSGAVTLGFGFAVFGSLGIWITLCSVIVIYAASRLNAEPLEHSKWGAIILVLAIIGSWSILNFIGGILALVYKPIMVGEQPQYAPQQQYAPPPAYTQPPQQATRICPQCGRVVPENVRFCPNCGKQLV